MEDLTDGAFAALRAHPASCGRYREMTCAHGVLIGVFTVRPGPQLPVGGHLIRPGSALSHPEPPQHIAETYPCHDKVRIDMASGIHWERHVE